MIRFLFRTMKRLLSLLILLFIGLWALLLYVRYPNPIQVYKVGFAQPSQTAYLLPARDIPAASLPSPLQFDSKKEVLPSTVTWYGEAITFQQILDKTATNAFLILRNGKVTYEWYRSGISHDQRLPSYSVAKTIVSILAGQLIAEGKLKESDRLVDFYPELKTGTDFDTITLQQLLDMQSGIDVPDNYPTGPSGWGSPIAQMYATTDMNYFLKGHRKMLFEPGSKGDYRSIDNQYVGMILRKVTGKDIATLAQERIWEPIGAEYLATWSLDKKGGIEKAFCCFNAAARDYAKLGLLIKNQGKSGSIQVIPQAWMKRLSTSIEELDGWGYSAFMWHPYTNVDMMLGLHEQIVYTDHKTGTIIVKLSDNLKDDENETVAVLKALTY